MSYVPKSMASIAGLIESDDFCKSLLTVNKAQAAPDHVREHIEQLFEDRYDVALDVSEGALMVTKRQGCGSAYKHCDRVVVATADRLPFCFATKLKSMAFERISYQDVTDRRDMRESGWCDRLTDTMEDAE